MKRFQKYELRDLIHDGPIRTYRAEEIASGRPVFVHLLTEAADASRRQDLLTRVELLKTDALSESSGAVIEAGNYVGCSYVVTPALESFTNLEGWLESGAKVPQDGLGDLQRGSRASAPVETALISELSGADGSSSPTSEAGLGPDASELPQSAVRPTYQDAGQESAPLASLIDGETGAADSPDSIAGHGLIGVQLGNRPKQDLGQKEVAESPTAVEAEPDVTDLIRQPAPGVETNRSPDDRPAAAYGQGSAEMDPLTPEVPVNEPKEGGEWLDLARAHLEQHAFNRALETLEQVLRLNPNDQAALQLLEEVKRSERETTQQHWQEAAADETTQPVPASGRLTAEVGPIEHHSQKDRERTDRAMLLLSKVQELCDEVRRDEGVELLRQAHRLDDGNPLISTMLVNSLFQRACYLYESDCEAADQLVSEILQLQPHHSAAKGLREQISGRKKEEHVAWCLVQARRLKAQGDPEGAGAIVREGLNHYPDEWRLQQFLTTHAPEQVERDTEDIKAIEDPDTGEAQLPSPVAGEPDIDAQPEPTEAATPGTGTSLEAEASLSPEETVDIPDAAPTLPAPSDSQAQTASAQSEDLSGDEAATTRAEKASAPLPKFVGIAAVAALVALLGGWGIWRLANSEATPPPVITFPIQIQSSPQGAEISVNGDLCGSSNCDVELTAGRYEATAELAGFRPAAVTFEIGEQDSAGRGPIVLTLAPWPTLFRVSSDLTSGTVSLGGEKVGELEDGEFELELDALNSGDHTVEIAGLASTATMTFQVTPGTVPLLQGPVATRNLKAVVVAGLGPTANVYSDAAEAQLSLDGQSLGELGADGYALNNLTEGPHELLVEAGRDRRKIVFDSGPHPAMAVFLSTDRNVGSLRVSTGEDGVTLYLNGTKYRRLTQRGQRLIYLYPKRYSVRVEKEGFRSPPVQVAEVLKGEETRLKFELEALPQWASLRIRNGLSGASVFLDGSSVGAIPSEGIFSVSKVKPGRHTIRLERNLYQPKQVEREFIAGETVELDGSLQQKLGRLQVNITPPNAGVRMTLRREGEPGERAISDRTLELPAGTYTVTARGADYQDYAATLRVDIDQTKIINLVLKPRVEDKQPPKPTLVLSDWAKTGGWDQEGGTLVRRGGEFVLAPANVGAGTYHFTARLLKGRRLEWVVNYVDSRNYLLYQIGKTDFRRVYVANGNKERSFKVPHGIDRDSSIGVLIEVRANSIVHKIRRNDEWAVIERFSDPATDLSAGKFGFHVPRRDEISLSGFSFVPEIP